MAIFWNVPINFEMEHSSYPPSTFASVLAAPDRRWLPCLALALITARAACLAADGDQCVVFESGTTVIARVVAENRTTITIDAGHGELRYPRTMIRSVTPFTPNVFGSPRGPLKDGQPTGHFWIVARSDRDSEVKRENHDDKGSLELILDGLLTWGVTHSTANLSTSLKQSSNPGSSASGSASTKSLAVHRQPGAHLRCLVRWGESVWRPLAGLQIVSVAANASGYTERDVSLEALGGVSWDTSADVSWQFLLGAGLSRAPWSLSGNISTTGLPPESYASSGTASGPLVRCEGGPSWLVDNWRIGLLGGVRWSRQSGSSTWTSSAGGFSGADELRITSVGLYVGGHVGCVW